MSKELVEEVYSSPHSKSPTFSYCGKFIFFLHECGQDSPTLRVKSVEKDRLQIDIDSHHLENISEIYSSHLKNHLAILTQKGRERAQIHVFEWKEGREMFELEHKYSTNPKENKKHFWGGFEDDGFVFFRGSNLAEDSESWELWKYEFTKTEPEFKVRAGYFPEMIGKSGGQWVWRNKVTTTKSMLNGKGNVIEARISKCHHSDDGKMYAIVDYENASAGEILRISGDQDSGLILHENEKFVSHEWISSILPKDFLGDIPLGELDNFLFLPQNKILFHINENGTSELLLADLGTLENARKIVIKKVEKACGGKVWINAMKISQDKKKIVLEVVNYNVSSHLWLYDVESGEFSQFTTPSNEFGITTESLTFSTSLNHYGQISMQYLEVKQSSKEPSKGTVILFHGGPAVQTHVGRYFDRVVTLAGAGYTVLAPNPAGSLGRGGKNINLDRGKHRINQFEAQVIPFVKKFTERGPVHLYGGSYAGWLITKILNDEIGREIKSAVIRNGVVDWHIFADKTPNFRKKHRAWEYVGEESFESRNALELLERLTPGNELKCSDILLFTGGDDSRVPPASTKEFLLKCGISNSDIEKIHTNFEDEGHVIKGYKNRVKIMLKTLNLFSK